MTGTGTWVVPAVPTDSRSAAATRLRHPLAVWLVVVLTALYTGLGLPRLFGHSVPAEVFKPVLSLLAFGLLFGGALAITAVAQERNGVRRLLTGLLRWRIGAGRWLLVLTALPALTLGIAAATGSLNAPTGGWFSMIATYLLDGIVIGALSTSLWEEAAWSGFFQSRLMRRHGLISSACLTAIPFAIAHIPGGFQNTTTADALVNIVAIVLLAPLLRYVAGVLLLETGGSVLAVAIFHASFNASGRLTAATGGWQLLAALVLLTVLVATYRLLRRRAAAPTSAGNDHPGRSTP
jgi:membrane protease YdiL (CAAX protease family)